MGRGQRGIAQRYATVQIDMHLCDFLLAQHAVQDGEFVQDRVQVTTGVTGPVADFRRADMQ